jgi:hypothetical protein
LVRLPLLSLLYQPPDDGDDDDDDDDDVCVCVCVCGEVAGMRSGTGHGITRRKLVPVSPQNPYDLIWDRTRAVAVGSRQLTA